jgi:hypothetical protein
MRFVKKRTFPSPPSPLPFRKRSLYEYDLHTEWERGAGVRANQKIINKKLSIQFFERD